MGNEVSLIEAALYTTILLGERFPSPMGNEVGLMIQALQK